MNLSLTQLAQLSIAAFVLLCVLFVARKKIPRRLKNDYFTNRWRELQKLCRNPDTWIKALIDADNLLDEALKKRRYPGKSMGERLVAAQRDFTNNDALWYGHKLRMKVESHPKLKLRQQDIKNALMGIRQALKDLNAL